MCKEVIKVLSSHDPVLEYPGVTLWTRSFVHSPIPLVILNKKLRFQWMNSRFIALFGQSRDFINASLYNFFKQSFGTKEDFLNVYKRVSRRQNSFSWKGQVMRKGISTMPVIANLILIPAFLSPADMENPVAYAGILDNLSNQYQEMQRMTFSSLLEASRLKDNDTGNHNARVNHYSRLLARALRHSQYKNKIDFEFINSISFLSAMHDVGKIGTPDDILNKKGPLEKWERDIMEDHTINGAFILSTYPNPMAREIALHHHEKWDGSGYPYGFDGYMIPLAARIVAVADVYDALRMKRSYKEEFSHEKARALIIEGAGKQFDPLIIRYFEKIDNKFNQIYEEFRDNT